MSMGTKTGAMMAHLADALPMARLIVADSTMKARNSGMSGRPLSRSKPAPSTAKIKPRWVQLK